MSTTPSQEYYQTPGHVIAAGVAFAAIDIIAVALRFCARRKQKSALKADDWLIVPATILTVAIGVALVYAVRRQALAYPLAVPDDFDGDPLELVTDQISLTSKIEFSYVLMLPIALGCIKLSVICLYMRIFAITTKSKTNIFLTILMVLVGAWTVSFFFASLFQCKLDIWAIWGSATDLQTHCPGTMYIDIWMCSTDFIADLIIIFIPAPLIWRLNLSLANKIATTGIFLLGAVAVVASLIRLIMMAKILAVGFDPDADEILVITKYLYWGMVELGVGILAACLPVAQGLFRKLPWATYIQSIKSTLLSKSSKTQYTKSNDNSIRLEHTVQVSYNKGKGDVSSYSGSVPTLPGDPNDEQYLIKGSHATSRFDADDDAAEAGRVRWPLK